MTTDNFHAERQPNGDVWITSRKRPLPGGSVPLALVDSFIIKVPKEHCAELAALLWPNMGHLAKAVSASGTDYGRAEGEPE